MRSIALPITLTLALYSCAAAEESEPAPSGNGQGGSLHMTGSAYPPGSAGTVNGGAGRPSGTAGGVASGGSPGSAGSKSGAGTAGTPAGGSAPGAGCVVTAKASGTPALVDDFEDGNADVGVADGRVGSWYLSTDATGTTTPAVGAAIPADGGNPGKALHVAGSELTSWGASLSASITPADGCYDASKFTGITVSLKGSGVVWVSVLTAAVRAAPEGMRNHYKKQVTLSATWTEVTIDFNELTQPGGWGSVVTFDLTKVYGIDFGPAQATPPATTSFDFWVDNLTFK